MAETADIQKEDWVQAELEKIPKKLSFRIGEVARILSVKPYILRYWESEFDQLKPRKLDNKQRLYFHKDIETLLLIKKLLYRDGYSIRGAKQALRPLNKEYKKSKNDFQVKNRLAQEAQSLLNQVHQLKELLN